ncbi:hypothetical protein [Actinomycetospora sp.]|uniref:hypothetical protein n=1 Tax=Actinomycetospora sp. TaxID=1872135 RepID=UPI002F42E723
MNAPPTAAPTAVPSPPEPRGWRVDVPLVGPVGWPPTGSLAFLGVMVAFAAFEVVSWPIATALAVGHVLAREHDFPVLREVGAGLEDA